MAETSSRQRLIAIRAAALSFASQRGGQNMLSRREFGLGAASGVGAVTLLSSEAALAASGLTVSFNVVYPNQEGARFDIAYYRTTHIPLVMKIMKADKVILIEGVPNGAAPPPYAMIAHFQFASTEALQAALANPAMAELRADLPRFTDIRPTIMLGKSE
jgi:uncharacterized protein (TIGR02118 family)